MDLINVVAYGREVARGRCEVLAILLERPFRLQGAGCRVQGSGCRVQGAGFREEE